MGMPIERYDLDGGGILLVSPKPESPCAVVFGTIRAGALREPESLAGLSDFTARLLMRGTRERSYQQIAEELEAVGASIGFSSDAEATSFSGNSLPQHVGLIMENVADCLKNAAFPAGEVEKVRGQMITGLRQRGDDTRAVAADGTRELTYPEGHPYRRNGLPTEKSLQEIGAEDISAFRDSAFGPQGMIVAVSGSVTPSQVREHAEAAFGRWSGSRNEPAPIADPPVPSSSQRRIVPMMHKSQADIVMAFLGVRRSDPQFYALTQANLILGRLGLMGRLGQHVRDELGLAYYCSSDLETRTGVGLWSLRAGVNPANVDKAIEAMSREVANLSSAPVLDEEIADAQQNQVGSMALRLERSRGVASAIHYIEYHGLGLDYLERFPSLVRSVTREQIVEGARRYLNPDVSAAVIAGPLQG